MLPPEGTTWDNRQPSEWPERTVAELAAIRNPLDDGEPFAQYVVLSCGHWLVNSYGVWFEPLRLHAPLRCRVCFFKGPEYRQLPPRFLTVGIATSR